MKRSERMKRRLGENNKGLNLGKIWKSPVQAISPGYPGDLHLDYSKKISSFI